MRLSGLILDVYDDCDGNSLKSMYPSREDIPFVVKTAHALSLDERNALPDDVYALVMTQEGSSPLRKYACVDPGNTVLAVQYFLNNADKLPVEAQKTAAANLVTACGWYDLQPPEELSKLAGIGGALKGLVGAAMPLAGAVVPGLGTAMGVKDTASSVGGAVSKALRSKGQIDPSLLKSGEVAGTSLMPQQGVSEKGAPKYRTVVKKAAVGHLVQGKEPHPKAERSEELEQNRYHREKNPPSRQHRQLVPYVNIQGQQPPSPTTVKVSHYALRNRYPLDSYEQVKCAAAYFDDYCTHFDPEDRHTYCQNLVKRAEALCIPVSDMVRKYGSASYAPAEEMQFALDTRRSLLLDEGSKQALDKLACAASTTDPEVFATALALFDKEAGLQHYYDRDVLDPFFSTFGFSKKAEFTFSSGNDYVNEDCLRAFALSGYALVAKRFGEDTAKEFQKDPVGIFESLPLEQKKVISRLATDSQPGRG